MKTTISTAISNTFFSIILITIVYNLSSICPRLLCVLSTSCRDHVLSVTMPRSAKGPKCFQCGRKGHKRDACPVLNAARTLRTPDNKAPFYRQVQEAKKQRREKREKKEKEKKKKEEGKEEGTGSKS
ncbi:hypothetical protein ATEIFO6365_0004036000 [Aspergillus terreus]|uniref:Uncharacterized protein n=1 Tax=Aspergillus terreus TaxID=33178 RepID=A0A5M3YP13_ASPTE|nr:hypothetical protein ATETN484_0002038500 [Aspergillus terreus]GFF15241.1 hypothetical protein ATEIFO6365_0004036000 [Aspergillus terreus]